MCKHCKKPICDCNTYNGWANYETWNVARWIQNNENWYLIARDMDNYDEFVDLMNDCGVFATGDLVSLRDEHLDYLELTHLVGQL